MKEPSVASELMLFPTVHFWLQNGRRKMPFSYSVLFKGTIGAISVIVFIVFPKSLPTLLGSLAATQLELAIIAFVSFNFTVFAVLSFLLSPQHSLGFSISPLAD